MLTAESILFPGASFDGVIRLRDASVRKGSEVPKNSVGLKMVWVRRPDGSAVQSFEFVE